MSIISNIHTAQVYDPKHSKAQFGQRLVVTIAKKDSQGNYGPHLQQTMATSIPLLTAQEIAENAAILAPHIAEFLATTQNALINARIKSGIKTVTSEDLSIVKLVEFLNESTSSDRWDSERVLDWFNSNLAEPIGLRLIANGADESKMEKILLATAKRFSDTLGGRGVISIIMATELKKALTFTLDKNDPAYIKFSARINKALEAKSLDDSLGF